MLKVLVSVDGSANSLRAVQFVVDKLIGSCGVAVEIHLLNVQPPVATGDVTMFVSGEQIDSYCREEGLKALHGARELLDRTGLPCRHHIVVGHAPETIAHFAQEQGCDMIVMGTRGLGSVMGLLMGSVTTKVVNMATMPVLLVK